MTDQIICNSDEVRHIGVQIGDATETYAGTATDRIVDAAHNQGEGKWGNAELGAPAIFGEVYARRLLRLEEAVRRLAVQVEDFSRKVQDAATRANAADAEVAELLLIQEESLDKASDPRTLAQPQSEAATGFVRLG